VTLAVAQRGGAQIRVFKGLDLARPDLTEPLVVPATPRLTRHVGDLVAADLKGDGIASFIATVPEEGQVVRLSADDTNSVGVHEVWSTDRLSAADQSLPVDFDGDGDDDLFLLGQNLPRAVLLLSDDSGGFIERSFPLPGRGARSGALIMESDGTLLLWATAKRSITVLRWPPDRRNRDPSRIVFEPAGRDWMRFAIADLDRDGHDDMVLGSSVGFTPPTVLYGPLDPKLDAIIRWLEGRGTKTGPSVEGALSSSSGG
jgi:hypothetical protein